MPLCFICTALNVHKYILLLFLADVSRGAGA
jgi:hypothetical protein